MMAPVWLKTLEILGQLIGVTVYRHRHSSIGHKNSPIKYWPGLGLAFTSQHPVYGEDQSRGRTPIGATIDGDLPLKIADDRLDKL